MEGVNKKMMFLATVPYKTGVGIAVGGGKVFVVEGLTCSV